MSNNSIIEQLVAAVSDILPENPAADVKKNLRATLQSACDRLDLVTREELAVQEAVLARTRARLEQLEKIVAELEQKLLKE